VKTVLVAQISKSAVSPTSKSARRGCYGGLKTFQTRRFGNLRHSRLGSPRYMPGSSTFHLPYLSGNAVSRSSPRDFHSAKHISMDRVEHTVVRKHPHTPYALEACLALVGLLFLTGCVARVASKAGDFWGIGLARQSLEVHPFGATNVLVNEESGSPPVDFRFALNGIELGLGTKQTASAWVLPNCRTNGLVMPRIIGLQFHIGSGKPWTVGMFHYRVPRLGTRVQLVATTVKGAGLRLATDNPSFQLGASRTTVTTIGNEPVQFDVEYNFPGGKPEIQIINPYSENEMPP
jgi:hypothetical protein